MKWHHNLDVWKRSMELVTDVYKITDSFPDREQYGLTQQMRRAAVSIPSNIAEGSARKSAKEFLQYLSISQGSMAELETQLIIARNLKYCADIDGIVRELDELSKMTTGLYKTIGSKQAKRKATAKTNEN